MNPLTKMKRITRLILSIIKEGVKYKIALLKSLCKNRSPREENQIITTMQKINYCKELIQKEGAQKFQKFCECLSLTTYNKNEVVIKKGDFGQRFFLILKGTINIVAYNPKSKKALKMMQNEKVQVPPYEDQSLFSSYIFKELNEGDHFGDMALIDQGQVSATIQCKTDCDFAFMDKHQFWQFLGKHQPLIEKVQLLKSQTIFQCWNEGDLRNLSYEFKMNTYHNGSYIYLQGEQNTAMYLVQEGHVEISIDKNNKNYLICRIDSGSIFGDDEKRYTCNAKCGSARAQIYKISKNLLFHLFEHHPDSRNVYENQSDAKKLWRQSRLELQEKAEPKQPKLRRPQSMIDIEFTQQIKIQDSNKFQKLFQLQTPTLRRISNQIDDLDLDQKKDIHKQVLQKLDKHNKGRQLEFFSITKNFKEARRKEQHSQTKFLNNLQEYLKRGNSDSSKIFFEIEHRSIRTSSQSGIQTVISSPNQSQRYLSPIPQQKRKQLSIQGIMLKK